MGSIFSFKIAGETKTADTAEVGGETKTCDMGGEEKTADMAVLLEQVPELEGKLLLKNRLDIGERQGSTDYIDFLTPNDMKDHNFMWGIDCFRRPFLAVKYFTEDDFSKPRVFAVFQRYTDTPKPWVTGGDIRICGALSKPQWKFIRQLIQTGTAPLQIISDPYAPIVSRIQD